jgi:hypothetical protein
MGEMGMMGDMNGLLAQISTIFPLIFSMIARETEQGGRTQKQRLQL